jgi:hypothetical protein
MRSEEVCVLPGGTVGYPAPPRLIHLSVCLSVCLSVDTKTQNLSVCLSVDTETSHGFRQFYEFPVDWATFLTYSLNM